MTEFSVYCYWTLSILDLLPHHYHDYYCWTLDITHSSGADVVDVLHFSNAVVVHDGIASAPWSILSSRFSRTIPAAAVGAAVVDFGCVWWHW